MRGFGWLVPLTASFAFVVVLVVMGSPRTVSGGPGCGDSDIDGVCDSADNCVLVPNGPALATGSCDSQEDGDMDGYGNPCDTDFNNDGATGPDDLSAILGQVLAGGTDPEFDPNCDGGSGPDDLSWVLSETLAGTPPGPSGLACAGTIPCP